MTVRLATVDDAEQIAVVHVQSWRAAYRGLLPDDFLNNLSLEQRIRQWQSILSDPANIIPVYEDEGQVVGFVSYGRTRDEDLDQDKTGEIYAIYLLPDRWGQGFGAALMHEGLKRLQEQGYQLVSLWVLAGNNRAIQFYEQFGFKADGATKVEERPVGIELREVRYVKNFEMVKK